MSKLYGISRLPVYERQQYRPPTNTEKQPLRICYLSHNLSIWNSSAIQYCIYLHHNTKTLLERAKCRITLYKMDRGRVDRRFVCSPLSSQLHFPRFPSSLFVSSYRSSLLRSSLGGIGYGGGGHVGKEGKGAKIVGRTAGTWIPAFTPSRTSRTRKAMKQPLDLESSKCTAHAAVPDG